MGAIAQAGGGWDAVSHRSAVHGDAERVLVAGSRVCFDVTLDAAGVWAANTHTETRLCCELAEALADEQAGQAPAGGLLLVWRVPPGLPPRPWRVDGVMTAGLVR
ncbi:hypothetical protein [Streptomyces sp. S.PNR 29]|uniref:hypothetical protein n=1 Tax=Streptomyces sp. S.PNR 29 TaxID=2973805 RepID=UPI0025AF429D|nr:hypothetical protein [Streptomyces sp. S.PNR 29]MDN0200587.1 cold shock domain-containing protein [Streptomyces sp. S.PNR 29]